MRSVVVVLLLSLPVVACSNSTAGTRPLASTTPTATATASEVPGWPPPAVLPVSASASEDDALAALRARPLWLPRLPAGTTCPAAEARAMPGPIIAMGFGDGPLYVLGSPDGGAAVWRYGERGAIKTVWQLAPAGAGPLLVRGRQLDGVATLRFDDGAAEMTFPRLGTASGPGAAAGWRDRPSLTLVAAPGCYAFQIDGPDFTSMVVFEARSDASMR